jgi:hypothetical protein
LPDPIQRLVLLLFLSLKAGRNDAGDGRERERG